MRNLYIVECLTRNADNDDVIATWEKSEALDAAQREWEHMTKSEKARSEIMLHCRLYSGGEDDANSAWDEMLDNDDASTDDTLADCELLYSGNIKEVKYEYVWTACEDYSKPNNNYSDEIHVAVCKPPFDFLDYLENRGIDVMDEYDTYYVLNDCGERTGEAYQIRSVTKIYARLE